MWIIKSMENKYLMSSLDLVEDVFAKWDSKEEGKIVRQLVEEIRSKKYYVPELELVMVDEEDMGFKAILVEGNPRNYNPRGFKTSYDYGIKEGPNIKLPHRDCLMVKELVEGTLDNMSGLVDYSFYEALHEG